MKESMTIQDAFELAQKRRIPEILSMNGDTVLNLGCGNFSVAG